MVARRGRSRRSGGLLRRGLCRRALLRGRVVAPLAAFGAFVLLVMSSHAGFGHEIGAWSILPASGQGGLGFDSGIYFPFLPDLAIARTMSLVGFSAAALGLLGLRTRTGGVRLARTAAVVTVVGLLAVGTVSTLPTGPTSPTSRLRSIRSFVSSPVCLKPRFESTSPPRAICPSSTKPSATILRC